MFMPDEVGVDVADFMMSDGERPDSMILFGLTIANVGAIHL